MVTDYSDKMKLLSRRHGDCLREAAKSYSAKEIGQILGLSPHTVNNLIFEARQILGGVSRRVAAQMFVAWEGQNAPSEFQYLLPPHLMTLGEDRDSCPDVRVDEPTDTQTQEAQAIDSFAEEQRLLANGNRARSLRALRDLAPVRIAGRHDNDLTGSYTLIIFVILMAALLVIIGSAVSLLSALNTLVSQ
ncbi:LuxR C-terminal-related transcriptional regulator [Novosphingobium barchaimii]|uniref:LuxR C-terminal-related transcriptional regulator n=1 Tax=Novosphingobium barchaimii TaxID=1420591 RepID=UPI00146FE4EB|nr:LuxR C-terminal-related transcriptional regulator [Novosphingobium barchaimii]